jgi:hypothetical protein
VAADIGIWICAHVPGQHQYSSPPDWICNHVSLGPGLTHAPDHPEIAEAAGVSLQLSGHTHRGQFIPWTWMVRPDLPAVCSRLKPNWQDAGFHLERSRNMGAAVEARIESRNCFAEV